MYCPAHRAGVSSLQRSSILPIQPLGVCVWREGFEGVFGTGGGVERGLLRQLTAAGKGEQGHVCCGLGDVVFPVAAGGVGEPTTTLPLIRF